MSAVGPSTTVDTDVIVDGPFISALVVT